MGRLSIFAAAVGIAASAAGLLSQSAATATIYEGGRLIVGDASAPIDNGAFVVQNGRITAIGRKGAVSAPANAVRVDLTGKTVMPTLVNVHVHIGYEGYTSWGADNYTPANVLDHLRREAFYGVGVDAVGRQQSDRSVDPVSAAIKQAGKFPHRVAIPLHAGHGAAQRRAGRDSHEGHRGAARRQRGVDRCRGARRGPVDGREESEERQDLGRRSARHLSQR